jgi:hypothetical protein
MMFAARYKKLKIVANNVCIDLCKSRYKKLNS